MPIILGVAARFFTADELNAQAGRLANPSEVVMAEVGCPGVAEGAALAASGEDGELIVAKTKTATTTCAIAMARAPLSALPGRARGLLSVVGIGPGDAQWCAPAASDALRNAGDWVGYGLYLDLASHVGAHGREHRFALGEETERVRHAIALAGEGRHVALCVLGRRGDLRHGVAGLRGTRHGNHRRRRTADRGRGHPGHFRVSRRHRRAPGR